jgi:hypothetical protein
VEKAASKLMRILKRQRRYVSFWEWPDSKMKELAIIEEFVASLTGCGGPSLYAPRFAEEVPPDIIANDAQGRLSGIEITHLAEEAPRQDEGIEPAFRGWTTEEVIDRIEKRIKEKDGGTYHGGPYADLLLLIHTDEPMICYEDYSERLEYHVFTSLQQLNKVYLLFSYDRAKTGYRCLLLNTA